MTPQDVIAEQVRVVSVHDGDVVIFEVAEAITAAQMRSFRRELHAHAERLGWNKRGILALAVQKGVMGVTRLTTKRLQDLEDKMSSLESRLDDVAEFLSDV